MAENNDNNTHARNRNRQERNIRGPQSALTDFLASQNISVAQIRADNAARIAATNGAGSGPNGANGAGGGDQGETAENANNVIDNGVEETVQRAPKRKATFDSKKAKRRKKTDKSKGKKGGDDGDDDYDDNDDDDLVNALGERGRAPLPGQQENCAICQKRFTVTTYSRSVPGGGLVCSKCGKDLVQKEDAGKKGRSKAGPKAAGRRKAQSRLLDGVSIVGVKSFATLCTETLAKNIVLADDLGLLPDAVVDRIARRLSKRRLLSPATLELFLRPGTQVMPIYDGSSLSSDDYKSVIQRLSGLKNLRIRNAIHFKDEVMAFLTTRLLNLESLYLHGANLISEKRWLEYLNIKGSFLKSLRVYFTDLHFNDNVLAAIEKDCPSLDRLKVYHNQEITDQGIAHICGMKSLQHLGLHTLQETSTEAYVAVINSIGSNLRTISLREIPGVDDRLLDAIRANGRYINKLRLTYSECMTDAAFVRLFTGWVNRPLFVVDFEACRLVDAAHPRANPDQIGFCDGGLRALMQHSGTHLRRLNIHGCRNISTKAFEDVFGERNVYPELVKMEISFCEQVTDLVVGCIFRSCPKLRELNVFGCMKVRDVRVPVGRILVGVPNALGMRIEGAD